MGTDEDTFNDHQLIEQLEVWRHNRALYPGWLVAPKETRERIWNYTKEWTGHIYNARDRWPAEQLLVLYREFFWRLDVSLHYLPDDLADAANDVLNYFGPSFGDSFPGDTFKPNGWPDTLVLTATTWREDWIAVACHVLRQLRITQNKDRFDRLQSDILAVARSDDDVKSRLAYDNCVWALSENDRDSCLKALNDWPTGPADPYWQVKRGALFAELGDVGKATSLMESALVALRSTQRLSFSNISAMSRESWTLQHLWQISAARRPGRPAINDPEFQKRRDRQRDLEAYRCSAEAEMRLLKPAIEDQPKPRPRVGPSEQPPDFDTGGHGSVFRWSGSPPAERLAPALNFLMMMERTGLPPYLKPQDSSFGMNFSLGAYQQSLEWVQEEFPALWASWVPRFDFTGFDDGKLSRQTIGGLSDGSVDALFVMAWSHLNLHFNQTPTQPAHTLDLTRWVEMATRLAVRSDDESRERLVRIALSILENAGIANLPPARGQLDSLFQRSLPFLDEQSLRKWLVDLLGCRLPPSDGLQVWQDPFELADREVLRSLALRRRDETGKSDVVFWAQVAGKVDELIGMVNEPDVSDRCRALVRLIPLNEAGFLTSKEVKELADAFWAQTDDRRLPVLADDFYEFVCLEMPEAQPGQRHESFFAWLDQENIEPRFTTGDIDGEIKRSLSSLDPDRFLLNLLQATLIADRYEDLNAILTEQRAHAYLEKILDWWEREADLYKKEVGKARPIASIDPTDRLHIVVEVLGAALLPAIGSDVDIRKRLLRMVREFVDAGFSEARAAPVLTFLDRKDTARYLQAIQFGLASEVRSECFFAIKGIHQWGKNQKRLDLPPLPITTLASVCFIIQGLVPPGARPALQLLGSLIKFGIIGANSETSDLVLVTLEAACRKLSYDIPEGKSVRQVDPEELPHLRRQLAHTIGRMNAAGFDVGTTIKTWLSEALRDPFIDVRHEAGKAMQMNREETNLLH